MLMFELPPSKEEGGGTVIPCEVYTFGFWTLLGVLGLCWLFIIRSIWKDSRMEGE